MLIGSPGRIWDVMQRCSGWLQLSALEVLVLDEADRLLDMGFKCEPTELDAACKVAAVQSLAGPCVGESVTTLLDMGSDDISSVLHVVHESCEGVHSLQRNRG